MEFDDVAWYAIEAEESDGLLRQNAFGSAQAGTTLEEPVAAGEGVPTTTATGARSADKIIHQANATILTESFDDTIQAVNALTDRHDGFIQQSNITGAAGNQWDNGNRLGRQAHFSIRIPNRSYRTMTDALDSLGVVSYFSSLATNVSTEYADITSRLASLRAQEERILAMLEQADTLTEMLDLEVRLGELIFQIERLTTQRSDLDQLIAYSTIDLRIVEVEDEEDIEDIEDLLDDFTVGETLSTSLRVLRNVGRVLLHILVAIAPWSAVVAVIVLPILWCVRRHKKKKRTPPDK